MQSKIIDWIKDKYYWYNNHSKLKRFFNNRKELKVLFFGYPKSGNTWTRFLIYNYRNLLLNPNEKQTLSYERLNVLQNNIMEKGTTFLPEKGFPFIYRTHKIYKKTFDLFEKKIFIHRNPLDTLVSAYYYSKNRDVPFWDDPINVRKKLFDIDFFVKYKIDSWINFYNYSHQNADIVLNYSDMKNNCEKELFKLIQFLGWELDNRLIMKSVDLSSFDNIRNMGIVTGQSHGMAKGGIGYGSFKGEFTRSGEESQFFNELHEETINFVLNKFPDFKKIYPNLID